MDFTDFLKQHHLPSGYLDSASKHFNPLGDELIKTVRARGSTLFVGINGSQGSGKTTMAGYLQFYLKSQGLSVCVLSIDDFYLTLTERQRLAQTVHPLFVTRGVPATHDVKLAESTLTALAATGRVALPSFDKATDDRKPIYEWAEIETPVDIVILEGWCVATPPQSDNELQIPINELEAVYDKDAKWREHINQRLASDYQDLWQRLDVLVMLKAPSFDCVYQWRLEQEEKLRQKTDEQSHHKLMSPEQIRTFITHYQRLTEHALEHFPQQCDWVFYLDANRQITEVDKNIH